MAIAQTEAVVGLLVQAGIIRDPSKVKSVTLHFPASGPVLCTVERFTDQRELESVLLRLRLAELGE